MYRQRQGENALCIRRQSFSCHHQRASTRRAVRPRHAEPTGNPNDGDTLAGQIEQVERITGTAIARVYVDRRDRGHDADRARVFISRQKRGITPTLRRELRSRAARVLSGMPIGLTRFFS